MKPFTIIIIKYAGILLLWVFILWWITIYSSFNIPEFIPYTPVKLYGFLFFGFTLTILIIAQKECLEKKATLSIVNLTLFGVIIGFLVELIFQFILSFTEVSDKFLFFVKGTITMTVFFTVLSFFVAFQLKTKRTGRLILFICLFLALFKVITMVFPVITKS